MNLENSDSNFSLEKVSEGTSSKEEISEDVAFEKVKAILSEQFDKDESDITLETTLDEDLEADSLDLVDLISSIEEEFDFEINVDDSVIDSIKTVDDIVKFILETKKSN